MRTLGGVTRAVTDPGLHRRSLDRAHRWTSGCAAGRHQRRRRKKKGIGGNIGNKREVYMNAEGYSLGADNLEAAVVQTRLRIYAGTGKLKEDGSERQK